MRFSKMAVAINPQNHGFKQFVRPPRCKLPSFSQLDYNILESSQTNLTHSLHHVAFEFPNIHKSVSTPCLSLSTRSDEDIDNNPRIEIIGGRRAPKVHALVVEVAIAMASGIKPELLSSGLGGAYLFRATNGNAIAVAKPADEEPLALNNPKGFAGRMLGQPGMKRSIKIGETGIRESAAYLLDHDGFAGVPPTTLVKISHVTFNINDSQSVSGSTYKIASLQRFMEHHCDAGDLGASGFSVASIHRIGILDIRLLNLDRHAGNILVKQGKESYAVGSAELIPIDHGLCLPESLDDPYFEWLHWPQASIPFSESEMEYICGLDPFKDADLLRSELPSISESSIRVLVVCTILLKQAVTSGLCLAQIGEMMTRKCYGGQEEWSALEKICFNAKVNMESKIKEDNISVGEEKEKNDGVFQFDDEDGDNSNQEDEETDDEILQGSPLKVKPPKIPRFSSVRSMGRLVNSSMFDYEEECDFLNNTCLNSDTLIEDDGAKEDDIDDEEDHKAGVLLRSMSFGTKNYKNDNGEGISFGEMSSEQWSLFLEVFEKLLPEAFEGKNCMCLSKQRLGSSCEF
ncbi:PREDICTED: phosphatidylinositol 4-kinase gamma 8-like [Nicotiana attenuata]|uniref:1-phosphatidylinositol 4-kinase n=1 Tax=Nicotiana attenuata TaxID=49451 RepID=A0A314L4A6_NICAT|nr:PREDICTED: phosphatidylinositol 4-kinase gamma 8-like [Nicotiana attenuata]OIT35909.1 phosphatidylinositol 4-kinase gamma 8 [Nicotiana attenuata]